MSSSSMQAIYLTGHSRPVQKVRFNFDGDLLFTCSDDKTVQMYETHLLERVGQFQINDSCKSIDVTTDSKYLLATANTKGVKIFSTSTGDLISDINTPGVQRRLVELSYSNQKFIVVSEEHGKQSCMRIYDFKSALQWGVRKGEDADAVMKHDFQLNGPTDHQVNKVVWGPLDKTIYYCTDQGRLIHYDLAKKNIITIEHPHKTSSIMNMTITHDFTMLFTCGFDGNCKLLHPETLTEIRSFRFDFPVRDAQISPLYEAEENQKFHLMLCGGQDAKDVTTTKQDKGGFEMKLFNIIHNENLANIKGHFGTVHTIAFHPDGMSFASGSEDGYVHYHRFLPDYISNKKRFE